MMLEGAEMTKNTFMAQKLGLGAMKQVQKELCAPPSALRQRSACGSRHKHAR